MPRKTPVIILDAGSEGYSVFNPNDWSGDSKAIAQSCAAHLSLLHFLKNKIQGSCQNPRNLCRVAFETLEQQYRTQPFPVDKMQYYAEVSEVHIAIASFLSNTKSLLDLLAQLVGVEGVANCPIHGFHKKKGVVGGEFKGVLENNAAKEHKEKARKIIELVDAHKARWIDSAVRARDLYSHPVKGMTKLAFELRVALRGGELQLDEILMPSYEGKDFGGYATDLIPAVEEFCREMVRIIKYDHQGATR